MTVPIRIGVMSDLHLEFEPAYRNRMHQRAGRSDGSDAAEVLRLWQEIAAEPGHPAIGPDLRALKAAGVDLLLLAGDIDVGARGIDYAAAAAGRYLGCGVIYVAGNHEHYRCEMHENLRWLRSAAEATGGIVRFLENDRVDLHVHGRRVAVHGCTLWTDLLVNGNEMAALRDAWEGVTDFRLIEYGHRRRFTPAIAQALHRESRAWLAREMPKAHDEADVVILVTHHGPIPDANPPRYRGGKLAPTFVSDMRQEITTWRPDLVVWGHTHHSMQDDLGGTHLLSAQRGYIGIDDGAERFTPVLVSV